MPVAGLHILLRPGSASPSRTDCLISAEEYNTFFGSHSRDEADEHRDIDILVELDYSRPIGLEFIGMQLDLEELLDRKVDLLTEKSISKHIKPYIDKDKILIYAEMTED